jgi:hypothetical protein
METIRIALNASSVMVPLIAALLVVGWFVDKAINISNQNKNIYRDAAREQWQSEKKESL